jgi:hypothetical protein
MAKVALAVLKNEKTTSELAARFGVSMTTLIEPPMFVMVK